MTPATDLAALAEEERKQRPDAKWLEVNLLSHDLYHDGFPHKLFRSLREDSPVWRHHTVPTRLSPGGTNFWVVLGHPEVLEVSRDWQRFTSLEGPGVSRTPAERSGHTVITSDPPGHTRLRKLVNAGFTPRMIARLDELVVRRTNEVLDAAAEKNDVNFVRDIAYPLPMHL